MSIFVGFEITSKNSVTEWVSDSSQSVSKAQSSLLIRILIKTTPQVILCDDVISLPQQSFESEILKQHVQIQVKDFRDNVVFADIMSTEKASHSMLDWMVHLGKLIAIVVVAMKGWCQGSESLRWDLRNFGFDK